MALLLFSGAAFINAGATSAVHIHENLNVPDFELTARDRRLLARARPNSFKRWQNLSEERACEGAACV